MSNKVKDIVIKNHTYPFFNDIVNVKTFVSHNIKLDEKSYRVILNCYIGYEAIKYLEYIFLISHYFLIMRVKKI